MNFNASRNVSQMGGPRKAKRISDVAAMGAPPPGPAYSPAPAYNQGFDLSAQASPYQPGIQVEPGQNFASMEPAGNFGYMPGYPQSPMGSAATIGSMLHQPIVQDMAMQYGSALAAEGRAAVSRELGRFVPVTRLRYYFAVDTRYVLRKLMLIVFPFTHKEWMVKYDQDNPVQPRYDVNAPDLYLPSMGYVTYVLLAGLMLGLQQRFSPEQISIQASSALAYIIFEMVLYLVTLYITNTTTALKTLDLLAFSGYKYCTMIASLLFALTTGSTGYYCCLVYCSCALSYFLVNTLRLQLMSGGRAPEPEPAWAGTAASAGGTKRRLYFLLFAAVTQPLLSWWLTHHLLPPR